MSQECTTPLLNTPAKVERFRRDDLVYERDVLRRMAV
jgi:hypothetical protein